MWRWQGLAALILALGVSGTLLTAAIAAAVNPGRMTPITVEEASALTTVLGAMIGALAVFLGVRNGHRPDPGPHEPAPPPDPAEASLNAAVAARARAEAPPDPATTAEAERIAEGPPPGADDGPPAVPG